jgi:hypothetical protein
MISEAPENTQAWPLSLGLGAVSIAMLNALWYREDSSRKYDLLWEQSGRWIKDDDGTGLWMPVGRDHGYFCIGDIFMDDPCPRLPRACKLEAEIIAFLFRVPKLVDAQGHYHAAMALEGPSQSHPGRTHNRIKRTLNVRYAPIPVPPRPKPFQADRLNVRVLPQARMAPEPQAQIFEILGARHEETFESDDEEGDIVAQQGINGTLDHITRQFAYDIMNLAANKKSRHESSHFLYKPEERIRATDNIFRTLDLRGVFDGVLIRAVDRPGWKDVFDKYFPPKAEPRGQKQNFKKASFFIDWLVLCDRMSEGDVEKCRSQLFRVFFNKLWWVPFATRERIWMTANKTYRDGTRLPMGSVGPAPWIAVNPRYYKQHLVQLGSLPGGQGAQDEDEDARPVDSVTNVNHEVIEIEDD